MNIDVNVNEISSVKKIVSELLEEEDFYGMNDLITGHKADISTKFLFPLNKGMENAEFISIYKENKHPGADLISEQEFYKITGGNREEFPSSGGKYQEYLWSHYKEARASNDEGYAADILNMALEFQNNLNYVKSLMKDKTFAKKWRREFGRQSAVKFFKNTGDIKIFNMINAESE